MSFNYFTDSHCHLDRLDLSAYNGSLERALQAARDKNVKRFLCIGVSADNAHRVRELACQYDDVDCSVGVHPLDVQGNGVVDQEWLLEQVSAPEVVAIGETGLDYHYQPESAVLQQASFALHLEVAKQAAKPIIIHTREAQTDTLNMLKEAALPKAGVMHCFTEDWQMAKAALDMGYYISMSGIVTFRNAVQVQEVARKVPIDRLLIETDSPYLAPIPYRGKPNLPEYVVEVGAFVAALRGVETSELAQKTTENYFNLFKSN
ncbi:TatD family hydrolase [Pseudomonas sp. F1_0610]|uniref:TatD family hydrolase n=1 Tax=Pseudomonas sp. F1_0610 TaxID=3114284 RepID=UPI0039C1130D